MVANGVGVVDPGYSGPTDEVKLQLLNITDAEVLVRRGDRLAQGIVLATPHVEWDEVDSIRTTARGGFGSTGH
jgi:dUTP pyrophosphatase